MTTIDDIDELSSSECETEITLCTTDNNNNKNITVLKYKIIGKPDDFIIGKPNDYHIGTDNANPLYNAKHTLRELSTDAPSARIAFILIILRKYKKYFKKPSTETNDGCLKNFCIQKGIGFIDSKNLREAHFVKRKLHLNKTSNRALTSDLLS